VTCVPSQLSSKRFAVWVAMAMVVAPFVVVTPPPERHGGPVGVRGA
jgi:ABC-type sulfate transport system permease component